jgi:hypothetical protein
MLAPSGLKPRFVSFECAVHFPNDSGARAHTKLDHDQVQEGPDRVGANIHSAGNFFACEALCQE